MSDGTHRQIKVGCDACGGYERHTPNCPNNSKRPAPGRGLDTLDFEGAWQKARGLLEDGSADPQAIRPGTVDYAYLRELLNAQVAALIAQAREEERALCVAELRSLKGRKIRLGSWYEGVEESAYQLTLKLPENHPIPEAV